MKQNCDSIGPEYAHIARPTGRTAVSRIVE